ncbi:MAG TPA: 1-(5-phosphoribosyl)-5-[(5-phosphoribosylamino)methylideneamino]imidazole-4-carboxamide isomerase [bacterium]
MIILPAVDLLDGRVVRLTQGRRSDVTVYSADPVGAAQRWVDAGATWLHVVDLNGAFDGTYVNLPIAREIIASCGVKVELSGGIRTQETLAAAIEAGASRVVLGTKASEDPKFVRWAAKEYGDKIAVAIDANAGRVVARGWMSSTALTPEGLARGMVDAGVRTLIATDVTRDGTMQGPNLTLLEQVLRARPAALIASGGIAALEHIRLLQGLAPRGIAGAIVGKALYEGAIDLAAAIRAVAPAGAGRRSR